MSDHELTDGSSIGDVIKRLSIVEKQAKDRVEVLEKQVCQLTVELANARVSPDAPVRELPCFAPYKKADGRLITSSAVKSTGQWFERAYLIPHEPLRRDMIEVDYLLTVHVKPEEPWKLVTFFSWYHNRFLPIVHSHHHSEEHILFPMISKIVKIPEKTSADHKVLLKVLEEISEIGKLHRQDGGNDINTDASSKYLPLLRAKWSELVVMMLPHLAEEEEQMMTFIKDAIVESEFDKMVEKIVRSEGIRKGKLVLPSILESLQMWGTFETYKAFLGNLPPPIRFMACRPWARSYQRYHRGPLNSLRASAPRKVIIERRW